MSVYTFGASNCESERQGSWSFSQERKFVPQLFQQLLILIASLTGTDRRKVVQFISDHFKAF